MGQMCMNIWRYRHPEQWRSRYIVTEDLPSRDSQIGLRRVMDTYTYQLHVLRARGLSDEAPPLLDDVVHLVKKSWTYIRPHCHGISTRVFANLIEKVVGVRECFQKLVETDRLLTLHKLKTSHTEEVANAIQQLVRLLDDRHALKRYARSLGVLHGIRTVRVEYLDLIVPAFVDAMEIEIKDYRMTPRVIDAWAKFFAWVVYQMKTAMAF